MADLKNARVLMLATDGFEQDELFKPRQALLDAGATVTLASIATDPITGEKGGEKGESITPDLVLNDVDTGDFDALVLPGGVGNPDKLRMEDRAVEIVQEFMDDGKIVAAICHAPWLLVEAGLAKGRRMTSFASIQTDVKNGGANWVDEQAVSDKGIVTSRSPKDLDAFVAKIVEEIGEGNHGDRLAA
jgi:protease I